MNVSALHDSPGISLPARADSFLSLSRDAGGGHFKTALQSAGSTIAKGESARDTAARLVGAALLEPLLAEMRESGFGSGPFAPSDVERRFGPLQDAAWSDRLAPIIGGPLADVIIARYSRARTPEVNDAP